ncbi:hypothetical protein DTO271D3_2015 [Paecilomyces variotii]|nr:hypothetical protein DTO271D3_2015 [Paecilomyces variotii]
MSDDGGFSWKPTCVASTSQSSETLQNASGGSTQTVTGSEKIPGGDRQSANYFKSADWSPDGTTIITNSADNNARTYILPPDLLEERESPHELSAYSTLPSAEPIYATAIYPYYSLQDPSTTLFLSSVRDHPIRLTSALAPTTVATYSLINPTTEAFITPHSILYPPTLGGTHFLTGSDSLICLFDVSRPGTDGPVSMMPTIPSKRKQIVGGGIGMKGIVSALAINPSGDGILAAGTFTRQLALYSSNGSGELIGTFSVARTEADRHIKGKGITQLLWSPCGRYLYVVERKSHGILMYDIRVTGQLLGWLQGRKAFTNQRLKADVVAAGPEGSHEIWAGGTDGFMRTWRNPSDTIGAKDPDWEWKVHEDSVSTTILHPSGSIVATCSGQKPDADYRSVDRESDGSSLMVGDNSLRIWAL